MDKMDDIYDILQEIAERLDNKNSDICCYIF